MDFDDVMRENLDARESVIEAFFVEEAKAYGCLQHKILGIRTWPDRALVWPGGVTDYVELKRPKGWKYQKGQQETHARLRGMGCVVEVLKTKAEVRAYFKQRAATMAVRRLPTLPKLLKSGLLCATDLKGFNK